MCSSTAELRGLTFVAVAVAAAGDYHCVSHEVFAEEAEQLIRDRVLFLRGGGLLLREEWGLLLLPDGIGFSVQCNDKGMIKHIQLDTCYRLPLLFIEHR